jgi:hypothetical protein
MSSNNPALFSDKILACLKAPDEAPGVERIESGFRSLETGLVYEDVDDLIPSLFMPTKDEGEDVTTRVKSFWLWDWTNVSLSSTK